MADIPTGNPFDTLPKEIQGWLRSEAAASIVDRLNERYSLTEEQLDAIPSIATWIPLLLLEPEKTIPALIDDFRVAPQTATLLAKDIEHLLFAPIKLAMRQKLGVDVEKMALPPAAAAKPVAAPARPVVADIKVVPLQKPAPQKQATPVAPALKKPAPVGADSLRIEKPIGLSEVLPKPPAPHELEKYEDQHPVVEEGEKS